MQTAAGNRSIVFSSSVILMTGALSSDGQPAQVSLSPLCGLWPAALPGQFAARCSRYVSVAVSTTFPAHETSWRTLRHGSPHRECICFALFNFQCSWGQKSNASQVGTHYLARRLGRKYVPCLSSA